MKMNGLGPRCRAEHPTQLSESGGNHGLKCQLLAGHGGGHLHALKWANAAPSRPCACLHDGLCGSNALPDGSLCAYCLEWCQ
jgi:hypothetical protein